MVGEASARLEISLARINVHETFICLGNLHKGRDEWMGRRVVQCLNVRGHAKINLETDGETSIVALVQEIA